MEQPSCRSCANVHVPGTPVLYTNGRLCLGPLLPGKAAHSSHVHEPPQAAPLPSTQGSPRKAPVCHQQCTQLRFELKR
eukprot:1139920-Pelagomonas_calceolata.AAC.2